MLAWVDEIDPQHIEFTAGPGKILVHAQPHNIPAKGNNTMPQHRAFAYPDAVAANVLACVRPFLDRYHADMGPLPCYDLKPFSQFCIPLMLNDYIAV